MAHSNGAILVTGGAGFIGTHLCRGLRASGFNVRVFDLKKPSHLVEGVEYLTGDVRDRSAIEKVMGGVDSVFHLAADVGVELCEKQPEQTYATNVQGTLNVLHVLHQIKIRENRDVKLIFSGSAVVYGKLGESGKPLTENLNLAVPISFYGAQKLTAEHAIQLYSKKIGIPAVCFRFFNVYGPGQDPKSPYSGVISIFIDRALQGLTLDIHGEGNQTRDFVSVNDIVEACIKAVRLPAKGCDGVPINLGTGSKTTVLEVAEIIRRNSGNAASIRHLGSRAGDILHSLASIQRANEILFWKPKVTLETGLSELLRL